MEILINNFLLQVIIIILFILIWLMFSDFYNQIKENKEIKKNQAILLAKKQEKIIENNRVEELTEKIASHDQKALLELVKLAEQGNDLAQYYLGMLHAEGKGVLKDDHKALEYYRKASKFEQTNYLDLLIILAEQGNFEAQNLLGDRYKEGIGVKKNYQEALNWYVKSAEQGFVPAQHNLGLIYTFGLGGVPRNYIEAYMWWNLAAKIQGDKKALRRLNSIQKRMTKEELNEAALKFI